MTTTTYSYADLQPFRARQPEVEYFVLAANADVIACYKRWVSLIPATSPSRVRFTDTKDEYWILWKRIEDESKEININRHRWVFFHPVVEQAQMRITTVEWFDMTAKPQVVTSYCHPLDFCRKDWNCYTETGYRKVAGRWLS